MKKILWSCIAGIVLLCIACALYFYNENSRLGSELDVNKARIAQLELEIISARTAGVALEAQAQACLEREAQSLADSQIWQDIIANAQSRDMQEEEKKGVPDDQTRRLLLDALDAPL